MNVKKKKKNKKKTKKKKKTNKQTNNSILVLYPCDARFNQNSYVNKFFINLLKNK